MHKSSVDTIVLLLFRVALACCLLFTLSCEKAQRPDASTMRPIPKQRYESVPIAGRIDATGHVTREGHFRLYLSTSGGSSMLPPVVVGEDVRLLHDDDTPFNAEPYAVIGTVESDARLSNYLTGKLVMISFKNIGTFRVLDEVVLTETLTQQAEPNSGIIDEAAITVDGHLWLGLSAGNGTMLPPVVIGEKVRLLQHNRHPIDLSSLIAHSGNRSATKLRAEFKGQNVEIQYTGDGPKRQVAVIVLMKK